MGLRDWIKGEVAALDARARPFVERGPWHRRAYEFLLFGLKEAWACLFGGTMLVLLVGTHLFYPAHAPLARYDFLALAALGVQALLLALKLEHWAEARVIFVFHVVGTVMELFKTAHGSWIYPEPSLLRIGGVPLFSGFMYACVGSYIARATRILDLRISHYPPSWSLWLLALPAYANFFTHHYLPDIRVAVRDVGRDVLALDVLVQAGPQMARPAGAAGVRADGGVHLVRREPWHLRGGVDLSQPERRLADGGVPEGGVLVPADAAELRAGQPGASGAGSGAGEGRALA